jgi:hypothetical protein
VGVFEDVTGVDVELDAFGAFGRLVRLRRRRLPFLQLPLCTALDRSAALVQGTALALPVLEGGTLGVVDLVTTGLDGQLAYAALGVLFVGGGARRGHEVVGGENHLHPPALVLALHVLVGPEDAAADHLEELSIELSSNYLEEISNTAHFNALNHLQKGSPKRYGLGSDEQRLMIF